MIMLVAYLYSFFYYLIFFKNICHQIVWQLDSCKWIPCCCYYYYFNFNALEGLTPPIFMLGLLIKEEFGPHEWHLP